MAILNFVVIYSYGRYFAFIHKKFHGAIQNDAKSYTTFTYLARLFLFRDTFAARTYSI